MGYKTKINIKEDDVISSCYKDGVNLSSVGRAIKEDAEEKEYVINMCIYRELVDGSVVNSMNIYVQ